MILTLNLSADEARLLQEIAHETGTTSEAVCHALIGQLALPRDVDVAADDPEARAEQQREQEEVAANVRRWHQEQSRP